MDNNTEWQVQKPIAQIIKSVPETSFTYFASPDIQTPVFDSYFHFTLHL